MTKCNRTLSASFSGSGARRPPGKSCYPSRSFASGRTHSDKYFLPAIDGIPEEEEDDGKELDMQDLNVGQFARDDTDSDPDETLHAACARSLAISVDADEIPLSEIFAGAEIYLPISP